MNEIFVIKYIHSSTVYKDLTIPLYFYIYYTGLKIEKRDTFLENF